MIILGVHYSHDAGAAIIKDGKIIAAVNEERYVREKLYSGFPYNSLREIFNLAGITPNDVDYVAFANKTPGSGPQKSFDKPSLRKYIMDNLANATPWLVGSNVFAKQYRVFYSFFRKGRSVLNYLRELGVDAPVYYVDHHMCHAASAYYTSGFPRDSLVVTTDGSGDGLCSTVSVVDDNYGLKTVAITPFFHSPASIYAYVTHNLGFVPNRHEGKITGLAAYGNPNETYDIFRNIMQVKGLQYKTKLIGCGRPASRKLHLIMQNKKREDIAAGVQKRFEEVCCELISNALKKYQASNIALAGGGFANVKANQRIAELEGVKKVFIHPNMGDGGLGVGAALFLWAKLMLDKGSEPKPIVIDNVYYGPEYSNEFIEEKLTKHNLSFKYFDDIENEVAHLINDGKIIGRFNGKMEYGPRALGNRSILASPKDKTINDWLNKRLRRSEFMPFAPSALFEYSNEIYKNFDSGSLAAQFMTITFDVHKKWADLGPAVVHIDNTARPQTVTKQQNKSYYLTLKAYNDLSGIPFFVNTSFNMHEEPIVCSPEDAIKAFKEGSVDFLAIGNYLCQFPKSKKLNVLTN
ncbi:carbamoyltransferase [Candidatus Woesearchaeota archaeon]|nr:carbamoyltransferase [Candidatus Woesearchaeota archaeon]